MISEQTAGRMLSLAAGCSEIAVGCSPVLFLLKLVGPIQSDRSWARRLLRKLRPELLSFADSAAVWQPKQLVTAPSYPYTLR